MNTRKKKLERGGPEEINVNDEAAPLKCIQYVGKHGGRDVMALSRVCDIQNV